MIRKETVRAYPMKVVIHPLWHIVIDDNIHALDVDPAAEQVRGNEDAGFELLEVLVPLDTIPHAKNGS